MDRRSFVRGVAAVLALPLAAAAQQARAPHIGWLSAGFVQTLSRPGRNLTGTTFLSLEVAAKRVELLKQAAPRARSLAVLSNVDHPGEKSEPHASEAAAQKLGINLVYVAFSESPFETSPKLDKALETVRRARPSDDPASVLLLADHVIE